MTCDCCQQEFDYNYMSQASGDNFCVFCAVQFEHDFLNVADLSQPGFVVTVDDFINAFKLSSLRYLHEKT